jgi:hypothetical protein
MKKFNVIGLTIEIKSLIVTCRRKLQQSGLSPKFYRRKRWILSRTACLGSDSAELISSIKRLKYPRINFQKNRIDHLNFLLKGGKTRIANQFEIRDPGIFSLVKKQKKMNLKFHVQPLLVLIDTYSELTDQEFVTNDGRKFFANYSDVNEEKLSTKAIACLGRIDSRTIYSNYSEFCRAIQARWPETRIVFVTYPTTYESRSAYLQQSKSIDEALNSLVKNLSGITVIKVPDEIVNRDEKTDNFPYHFGVLTKSYVAEEIKSAIEEIA